jgi:GTP-binding protein EngB required for normal cell division
MESLQNEKKYYLKEIDLREARIEETEFLIKIWQSTKINENEKKQLEKEYIKEYRKFDKSFKAVQNKIDNLRNQSFEKKHPTIERTVFDEDIHQWIFDTSEKQKIFEEFNNKHNLQMHKLLDEQRKLNDDFYRGYNSEIEKKFI